MEQTKKTYVATDPTVHLNIVPNVNSGGDINIDVNVDTIFFFFGARHGQFIEMGLSTWRPQASF